MAIAFGFGSKRNGQILLSSDMFVASHKKIICWQIVNLSIASQLFQDIITGI